MEIHCPWKLASLCFKNCKISELSHHLHFQNTTQLAIRLGIHTGLVVGDMGGTGRRDCGSVNRQPAMGRASCHWLVISEAYHTRKKAG